MRIIDLNNLTKNQSIAYNSIASEIKYDYNNLVVRLSEDKISNINWIVGSIASRNKYQSKLFERCCKLVLIQKLLKLNSQVSIIRLKDSALARIIKDYLKKNNYSVKVVLDEAIYEKIWRITRPFRQLIIGFYQYSLRYVNSSKKNIQNFRKINKPITLIDTFVINSTPGAGGTIYNKRYNDRYYTGLLDNLSDNESKNVYYLPTIVGYKNPSAIFSNIRDCKDKFIVPDDFMLFSDYLNILSHPFRLFGTKIPNIIFKGLNIKTIIKEEIYNTCSDQISLLGLFYFILPYRLKANKVKIKLLVDWFENQVIDRGLQVGFHRFLPNVQTIGYQGYIISPDLHLYIFPNETEILSRAIPDKIAVIGPGLISQIKMFSKKINVVSAPAFRFQKLWNKQKKYPNNNFFTILISLPISLDNSRVILEKIILVNDNLLKYNNNYRVIIKPHPTYTIDTIKSLVKYEWNRIYAFLTGDFIDALEQSNLVITNASSTAVEPLARAVPVIIVGEENGILENPIPGTINPEMWEICYSSSDIEKSIISFNKKKSDFNFKKEAEQIRLKYFNQVTSNSCRKFLSIK